MDYRWFPQAMELAIEFAVNDHDWMREGFMRARYALLAANAGTINLAKAQFCGALKRAFRLHDDRLYAEALLAKGVIQRTMGLLRSSFQTLVRARNLFLKLYRLPELLSCNIEILNTTFWLVNNNIADVAAAAVNLANEIRAESEPLIRRSFRAMSSTTP